MPVYKLESFMNSWIPSVMPYILPFLLVYGIRKFPYFPYQAMHQGADISNHTKGTNWVPYTIFEDGIRQILGNMNTHCVDEYPFEN